MGKQGCAMGCAKYSGTFADSVIKAKMEFERNGEAQSRD
jgi:hypothetical protein